TVAWVIPFYAAGLTLFARNRPKLNAGRGIRRDPLAGPGTGGEAEDLPRAAPQEVEDDRRPRVRDRDEEDEVRPVAVHDEARREAAQAVADRGGVHARIRR